MYPLYPSPDTKGGRPRLKRAFSIGLKRGRRDWIDF
jgi:hypothetical protein